MQSVQSVNIPEAQKIITAHNEHACFAVVWVQGASEYSEADILRESKEVNGVISVIFSRKNPYILLASYDPDITNSVKIMEKIQRPEIQTRIVGC